nr:hypothetical protein [Angustibacter aerolatus]
MAGALDLEGGVACVTARDRALIETAPPAGGMTVLRTGRTRAQHVLGAVHDWRLALAVENGPEQSVVSGPHDGLDHLERVSAALGVDAHRLTVPYPFHNRLLAAAADRFAEPGARRAGARPADAGALRGARPPGDRRRRRARGARRAPRAARGVPHRAARPAGRGVRLVRRVRRERDPHRHRASRPARRPHRRAVVRARRAGTRPGNRRTDPGTRTGTRARSCRDVRARRDRPAGHAARDVRRGGGVPGRGVRTGRRAWRPTWASTRCGRPPCCSGRTASSVSRRPPACGSPTTSRSSTSPTCSPRSRCRRDERGRDAEGPGRPGLPGHRRGDRAGSGRVARAWARAAGTSSWPGRTTPPRRPRRSTTSAPPVAAPRRCAPTSPTPTGSRHWSRRSAPGTGGSTCSCTPPRTRRRRRGRPRLAARARRRGARAAALRHRRAAAAARPRRRDRAGRRHRPGHRRRVRGRLRRGRRGADPAPRGAGSRRTASGSPRRPAPARPRRPPGWWASWCPTRRPASPGCTS